MFMQCSGRSILGVCLCVLLSLAVIVPAAMAQETTGGIRGYVKDKTGGSVSGAEVELTSSALITPKKGTADTSGFFYFQFLPPGEYSLTVQAKGFRSYKQQGILLETGKLPTYDVVLEIGAVSEIVEVSAK